MLLDAPTAGMAQADVERIGAPTDTGIFVVCVLAFRRGIVGELAAWRARRKG